MKTYQERYIHFFEELPAISEEDVSSVYTLLGGRRTLTPRQSFELTKLALKYARSRP